MAKDPGYLVLRGGVYDYVRRVPADMRDLVTDPFVCRSTKVRTLREARAIVDRFNRETEAHWRRLIEGRDGHESRWLYEAAVTRARAPGYQSAGDLAAGSLDEIVRRLELLSARGSVEEAPEVAAVRSAREAD